MTATHGYQEKKKLTTRFFVDLKERIWVPSKDGLEVKVGNQWVIKKDIKDAFGIVEDKSGNIWIGMKGYNGVVKYDGNEWISYFKKKGQLPSAWINYMYPASDGKVWFITDAGVCYYNSK